MLYDPNWGVKQTETKADPHDIKSLIAWLEKQPGDQFYCFEDNGGCLLQQYFTSCGLEDVSVGGFTYAHAGICRIPGERLPEAFRIVARRHPHTFGAALTRARAI